MAKLYFYFASMNAGKSALLLQTAFNYRERGMDVSLWTAAVDNRPAFGAINSRIGLTSDAHRFGTDTDIAARVLEERAGRDAGDGEGASPLACVLVDEAQFLTRDQVWQLARLTDRHDIPVICYGLRTDFRGELFPGSAVLLGIADKLTEMKAVCHCGRKATMNQRVDEAGQPVVAGAQTEIGGNERYVAVCRKHFVSDLADPT
ncbi:thymidine kinase [Alteriqipengyuania lutimaris]|uniref:Thymidine kinase n=1 Tax=Alteriqipengyuania lutimaris TaxID=1538146 RepID=A0A395LFZ8_9SPHN|nr:thymidine kinase [Alteriqipengyuania lutimaris]MBB3035104.1 thymidine kinase [Alteriqipengyuania lutimaris]RDS75722.1 thymidine kinase [Alteriqipengyuania lutimaris]